MYREHLVKCKDCQDIFKIVYDSKKQNQDTCSCKCGKLICYPDSFGGFSYDRNGIYEKLSYEESKYKSEYYEEDYIRLTEEESDLLNKIDVIGKEIENEMIDVYYTNLSDDKRIYVFLDGTSNANESMVISFEIRLRSYGQEWKDYEILRIHERTLEGLNRFLNIIIKVKNKEINLCNPRKIWDDDSLEWKDGIKTQQEIYDYELYC